MLMAFRPIHGWGYGLIKQILINVKEFGEKKNSNAIIDFTNTSRTTHGRSIQFQLAPMGHTHTIILRYLQCLIKAEALRATDQGVCEDICQATHAQCEITAGLTASVPLAQRPTIPCRPYDISTLSPRVYSTRRPGAYSVLIPHWMPALNIVLISQ